MVKGIELRSVGGTIQITIIVVIMATIIFASGYLHMLAHYS